MKSLKPIHWILIAIFLVEIVVVGVILIIKQTSAPKNAEISLEYATNEDGSYTLLSLTETVEAPVITFTYDDKEYTYDKSLVEILDAYQRLSAFQEAFENATEDMWKAFKAQVNVATDKNTHKQHPLIRQLRNIALTSYNVPSSQVYSNSGMYTVSASTTLDEWNATFGAYRITNDGQPVNEMALGASVKIGETEYPALVYTLIHDKTSTQDDQAKQTVSVFVLFGTKMINDIPLSDATISFLAPSTGEPFAHANFKVTYLATTNERCFRDLQQQLERSGNHAPQD